MSLRAGLELAPDSTREEGVLALRTPRLPGQGVGPESELASSVRATEELPARYEMGDLIGQGGTSRVYSALDRDLGREVAIKVIGVANAHARARYAREGRVMASLGHPNILPIYDVGTTRDAIFFTMPRLTGRSLGSLMREAVSQGRDEVMSVPALVEVVLKICDALAYAHARGVVHRDIKPDNVMIGDYGEVMVVDWGAADAPSPEGSSAPRMVGTPAYMSPEQVHGDAPTPRSDVYALGATLFHALLLRRPLQAAEVHVFWQRKLTGQLDPPTPEELARVPRALLAIAVKAMSHLPEGRYANVTELSRALRDFLSGRTAWAAPSVHETFQNDDYLERWVETSPGDFVRDNGRLVSRCERGGLLIFKQRVAAGVAVEFDGEMLDPDRPGDLSVMWTEEDPLLGGPHVPSSHYTLQVGAYANLHAGVYRDFWKCLSGRSLTIDTQRKYRIRAEIEEQRLRLLLDGELIAEYENLFPVRSGYLALYAYYPGKAFSNVSIYERGLPERVSPTAVGDAFFARGERAHAAVEYSRVEQLLPGTEMAEEARYKRGLCLMADGDSAGASEAWRRLESDHWQARAALHAVDEAFNEGRHADVIAKLEDLLSATPALRSAIIDRWTEYVNRLCAEDSVALDGYVALRDEEFGDHQGSASAAAGAEIACGRFRAVLERFPDQHLHVVDAYNLLGDFEAVVDRYVNAPWLRDMAILRLGGFDWPGLSSGFQALGRLLLGDVDGALSCERAETLLVAGRFERALDWAVEPEDTAAALRGLGRHEEALARGDARSLVLADVDEGALARPLRLRERLYLRHHLALRGLERGALDEYARHRDAAASLACGAIWPDVWLPRLVLFPLADELGGSPGTFAEVASSVLRERATHWYGKAYHLVRYVTGAASDDEFLSQPCRLYLEPRLAFARALRADLARDAGAARDAYAAFLARPAGERLLDSPLGDPLVARWAAHRLRELGQR